MLRPRAIDKQRNRVGIMTALTKFIVKLVTSWIRSKRSPFPLHLATSHSRPRTYEREQLT